MKLYGIPSCDSCRKALKTLEAAGHTVEFHDVRETPLSVLQIAPIYNAVGEGMLNKRATTWRELSDDQKENGLPMNLIAEHPLLMKRPIIEVDGAYHMGWTKDVQKALGL